MRKARMSAICLGVAFVCTFAASSARADAICIDDQIFKLNNFEGFQLNLPDESRAGAVPGWQQFFENNRGRHSGFSVTSAHGGLKFGLFKSPKPHGNGTSQSPEPAAIFLLGTGLAAAGAYARRRVRKSRSRVGKNAG